MSRRWARIAAIGAAITSLSCSGATEPDHADVDLARAAWLANRPRAYRFEVATASSWFPRTGYFNLHVADGRVVAASDFRGKAVPDFTLTVDGIWDQILAARSKGELNSALFNHRGVPVESDMGFWPADGGVRYSVRSFAAAP